jgi:hypothetical protein
MMIRSCGLSSTFKAMAVLRCRTEVSDRYSEFE